MNAGHLKNEGRTLSNFKFITTLRLTVVIFFLCFIQERKLRSSGIKQPAQTAFEQRCPSATLSTYLLPSRGPTGGSKRNAAWQGDRRVPLPAEVTTYCSFSACSHHSRFWPNTEVLPSESPPNQEQCLSKADLWSRITSCYWNQKVPTLRKA